MNKKDKEKIKRLAEILYFEKGVEEIKFLPFLRNGYPNWVSKLFYNPKRDYVGKWIEEKGEEIKDIIFALAVEGDVDSILRELEKNE